MSVSSNAPTFKVGLTADEKRLYSQLFKGLDPENTGIITGEKARATFEKSGLPPTILGEIWQIADQNNLGFLTQFGFCHAMRLIGYTQSGQHPSAGLADSPGPLPKFANLQLPPSAPLQPQSTNNSFMQSQPSSLVPQNTTTLQSKPQDPITSISAADYQKFSQLFIKTTGSPNVELAGAQARDIFLKAKLPHTTLGQIWSLVDRYNTGKLEIGAFVIAMHLIQGLLSGQIKQLPPFLPENVWQSVSSQGSTDRSVGSRQTSAASVSSQQTTLRHPSTGSNLARDVSSASAATGEWVISPTQKQQYESIFNNLDKAKAGQLNPDQVASFLMTSKLNQQDLATVWDLSDIQNTGVFTKLEFGIALFLVNKKLSGGKLPNIVPDELIESLKSEPQQQQPQQQQQQKQPQPPAPRQLQQQKTNMDDLVDIFGSASPRQEEQKPAVLTKRVSSSDLAPVAELPKVRSTFTGSFKPSSSFGQTLLSKQTIAEDDQDDLLGEDSQRHRHVSPPPSTASPVPTPASPVPRERKSVNYEALRSVPPPPPKKVASSSSQSFNSFQQPATSPQYEQPPQQYYQTPGQPQNEDLLADPETSGQLSQATSDIANFSNQIKSLATQTTGLHEKKLRAEQELQRILTTKQEIESKLKLLRSSYENEVKQVDLVESNLASAKEETEALRSEASIAEAKLNSLSTELNEKQVAMEELQKQNSSFKEKLGYVNAEIGELENQLTTRTAESNQLANQVSVRKSQVQVALVKSQDYKSKLLELEDLNKRHDEELRLAHEHGLRLQKEQEEHVQREAALKKEAEEKKAAAAKAHAENEQHKLSFGAAGLAAGGAIGAVVGGIAGAVGSHLKATEHTPVPPVSKEVQPEESNNGVFGASAPGNVEPQLAEQPVPSFTDHNVAALADEVQEKPSADMTGVEDLEEQARPESSQQGKDEAEQEELNKRFTEFPINESATENGTNATAPSSIVTDYKNEGETPVTSPSNSDFQFPQGSSTGIAGGLVGLPGGLVGVQRTDSLTSSVQNNAALSVRDDNIDEISDRDTLDIEGVPSSETIPKSADTETFEQTPSQERDSDADKVSSGVESFELVNAEEARGEPAPETREEEFPPIKELDYDDSSSSDEQSQEFDDAVDNLPKSKRDEVHAPPPKFDDFDNAFNDLEPTTPEVVQKDDFFADEFDDLEVAPEDNAEDEFVPGTDNDAFGFEQGFTEKASNVPDFSTPTNPIETTGNDEWEQLFAGFGNASAEPAAPVEPVNAFVPAAAAPAPAAPAAPATNAGDDAAIEELVGMGFEVSTAREALERENWNLEAATNYLLDNA